MPGGGGHEDVRVNQKIYGKMTYSVVSDLTGPEGRSLGPDEGSRRGVRGEKRTCNKKRATADAENQERGGPSPKIKVRREIPMKGRFCARRPGSGTEAPEPGR